jgi:16S rRNA (guanine1207-N2)-methyltransferase
MSVCRYVGMSLALSVMSEKPDHYFTAEPASDAERRSLDVDLAGRRVRVQTAPGVFCPDRVDAGTAILLREAPEPAAEGNLLDLGCGWGPIALTLGLLSPTARVWAVDVNRRALDLARVNAKALGINDFHAVTPDEVPVDIRFATIWSNPPIRVGKAVLHDLLLTWLLRLESGGTAYLVVQKNLGADSLLSWLAGRLDPGELAVGRHASAKGFRLLSVHRIHA